MRKQLKNLSFTHLDHKKLALVTIGLNISRIVAEEEKKKNSRELGIFARLLNGGGD